MVQRAKITNSVLQVGIKFALVFALAGVATLGSLPQLQAAPYQAGPQPPTPATNEASSPLTFQGWKNLRVDEARLVLERLTLESQFEKMPVIDRSPGEKQAVVRSVESAGRVAPPGRALKRADSRAEQARLNLEIAQDLTVNDYLLIYLAQFKSREAILDVARRLTPEDIADILLLKLSMGGQIAEHSISPAPRTPPRQL